MKLGSKGNQTSTPFFFQFCSSSFLTTIFPLCMILHTFTFLGKRIHTQFSLLSLNCFSIKYEVALLQFSCQYGLSYLIQKVLGKQRRNFFFVFMFIYLVIMVYSLQFTVIYKNVFYKVYMIVVRCSCFVICHSKPTILNYHCHELFVEVLKPNSIGSCQKKHLKWMF